MNWQNRIYESLVTEISVGTAQKVLDKRRAQADELGKARIKMAKTGRVLQRGSKTKFTDHPDHIDQTDLDDQVHRARQGLQGEKDKDFAVSDKQRSGVERRHKPGDAGPYGQRSAHSKLSAKVAKAEKSVRSPRRQR
jgi:hypothetical protein